MSITNIAELDQVVTNIANRCIELCAENSTTGNWVIDHDELADLISYEDYLQYFGFIAEELGSREEVLDLDTSDDRLDIIIGIAWVKNYAPLDDSEEEQALAKEAGTEEVKPMMSMRQTIAYLRARVDALQNALDLEEAPESFVQCPCCGKVAWFSDYDSEYHCGCCNTSFDLREVLGK